MIWKRIYLLLFLVSFVACTGGEKVTLEIKDLREKEIPEIDVKSHKARDVEVFRSNYLGDSYAVIMYREEDGKLHGYQTYVKASQNFDEVTYQWKNDNSIQFVLYSSENGQIEKYTMTTDGSTAVLEKFD